jgi:hypothetical protein
VPPTLSCSHGISPVHYAVCDPVGQKIGSAEEVFVNRDGEPAYIRVRIGLIFTRMVLIPVQFVETDDEDKTLVLK